MPQPWHETASCAPQCRQNRASPGFSCLHRGHPTGDHPLAIQLLATADHEPRTGTRATPPLAAPNGRKPNGAPASTGITTISRGCEPPTAITEAHQVLARQAIRPGAAPASETLPSQPRQSRKRPRIRKWAAILPIRSPGHADRISGDRGTTPAPTLARSELCQRSWTVSRVVDHAAVAAAWNSVSASWGVR